MKKRLLLQVLFFVFCSFGLQAQIVTAYQQGFEATGETSSYQFQQGAGTLDQTYASSGSRSIKLPHTNNKVVMMLDTIDLTQNPDWSYAVLEFSHMCYVDALATSRPAEVGLVEIRRVDENDNAWVKMAGAPIYDTTTGSFSIDYNQNTSFSSRSYDVWQSGTRNNSYWRAERFQLQRHMAGVERERRKYLIRFTLNPMVRTSDITDPAWYIDNIRVRVSSGMMYSPNMITLSIPELELYPNSQPTRLEVKASMPSVAAGQSIDPDSAYILYKVGYSNTVFRSPMSLVGGTTDRYRGYIPFFGYDTNVYYRIVVKDRSVNHNTSTYPSDESAWGRYHNIRGYANTTTYDYTASMSTDMPFCANGDSKFQFLYPQSAMQGMGFQPGAITQLKFLTASAVAASTRERVQIRMVNVPAGYEVNTETFYSGFSKIVYDSVLTLTQNNLTVGTIDLQDTFFYAGQDVLVIFSSTNNFTRNNVALRVRSVSTTVSGQSLSTSYSSSDRSSPFTSGNTMFSSGNFVASRPDFGFTAFANLPLRFDAGVLSILAPNDSTPGTALSANNIRVTIKNFGSTPLSSFKVWYQIDDSAAHSYNWTGNLAANATQDITISTTQWLTSGTHTIRAWVDDTLTGGGITYRDHEPLNDTAYSSFVSCNGAMNGIRQIGGTGADFATLDDFFFMLKQCGVNGVLTVKVAPGTYNNTINVPHVPGASPTNYIQFEPLGAAGSVVVRGMLNLQQASHVRVKDFVFEATNTTTCVSMGTRSSDCHFLNCRFSAPTSGVAYTLIYSGGADSLHVKDCEFLRGGLAISLIGSAADNKARGSRIEGSTFTDQLNNAIVVRNQIASVVDSNTIRNIISNSSYAVLLQDCDGAMRVTRNVMYVTSGASCIGVTGLNGTSSAYAVVANNMLVSNDEGTSNMLTTALNVINASYTKVVYNSVKLVAPTRGGIAAATLGGSGVNQCYFYNNIVSSFDTVNYAFNYIPQAGSTNFIGNNIYYSQSRILNRHDGVNCLNLSTWQTRLGDAQSQAINPSFIGASATDLRSYSANVKGHAQPVAEVTNDMFGTTRDASAPCVGAFEFLPLANDFAIEALAEPYDEYCAVPASAPLRVVIKNSGVNPFVPSATNTLRLYYSRGNRMGVLTPGQSGSVLVDRTIPGGDTIIFTTGSNVSFPVNGMNDTTYTFSLWLSSTTDPNISNDSSQFTVTARYQYPALTPITRTIDYGTRTTFNITAGLQSWDYALFNSGRIHKSLTYWYSDSLSNQPIFIGNDYTTAPLYQDTTFYIRQYRNMPIVVISEVQVIRTGAGVTSPQPLWMSSSTGLAVKLSNFGDVPAHIKGDRLLFVSNDDNLNNRTYEFPNVVIQPGESMVLQCRTNIGVVDSAHTLGFRDMSATTSTKLGIAYYDDTLGLMDVLPLNGITSETRWNNLVGSVPLTIWNGPAISLASTSAGVSRLRWPTSASTQSATCWQVADESHPMSMGTTNASMQRFTYNGCESAMSTVRINIRALPQVDMAVDSVEVPEGCGLGMEPIVVRMSNYGSASSDTTIWHYSVNGVVRCTDTLPPLAAGSSRVHTFSRQADLSSTALETQYSVRVWLDHNSSDASTLNDSSLSVITSRYTPGLANVKTYDTVQYASKDTLQAIGLLTDSLIWYDRQMRLLDTTNVYLTDFLYAQDTFYVSQVAAYDDIAQVGSLSTVMAANRYPSPYNTINNYGKEQYIYLGSEIAASGYSAGYIGAVSFYLESLTESSVTYDSIVISMAPTSLANFNSSTAWVRDLSRVYSRSNYTISQSSRGGWIRHGLDRPFYWDGIANVVVQVTRYISSARNSGLSIRSTTTGASRVIYSDNNSNANIASYVGSASRDQNVPDIRFAFTQYGCEGPKRPIYVNVQGAPDVDASLEWVWGSASASSCGPTQLTIDVRNGGRTPISNYTVDYWIDTAHARYTGTTTIAPGATGRVVVGTPTFTPGLHNLKAVVNAAGDTIKVNDTIVTDLAVSFCAGIYTIGPADSNDYHSFTEAVNTLNAVGVDGAVEFHVQRGVYNEQLTFSNIPGSSYSSPVTFRASENDSSAVVIRHSPTESANYVVNIENADNLNFKYLTFYAKGTGNYSTVVSLKNANNIHFTNSQIRVRGGLNTVSAVGFLVNDYVNYLYIDSCVIDSGFNAIRSPMTYGRGVMGLNVRHSKLLNFTSRGLFLTNASDAVITWNKIYSGVNINNRSLWGMYIADHTGGVDVEYNDINLFDERNGSKRGIVLSRCAANNSVRNKIYSNLISLHGTGNYDGDPSGIWIDSSTSHVNVYFNTVRLYAGTTSTASKSFLVRNASSNLYILNNLFDNLSQGYCYYVESPAAISLSDFNVYHTAMDTVLRHFVYWGRDYDNLDSMRVASGQDANSYNDDPYYVSDRDAHMAFGTYCELAQYNTEVPYDIDGEIRPQIPMPSIGADEVNRRLHDISIMEIFEPNADMDYIEDDVHRVVVKLYNNGSSTESNLSWTAEIAGSSPLTITTPRQIASLAPGRSIIDTAYLTLPIGIIDTQKVVVKFMPMDNDLFVDDNVDTVEYFIDPSYNMRADAVSAVLGDGCRLYETPLTIRLTNVGRKDIPTSVPFTIGFEATSASPDVIVSQFPLIRTEQITLPVPLAVNASIDIPFTTMANLYPTGNDRDVAVRLRAWQTHPYDQKPITDTTPYINVTSKYTPHAPIGQDLRLPYASWDTLWATQTDLPTPTTVVNRPIRWHRDSTEAPYFESANYLRSTWWETPQYFHDSVYYLSCISTSGCTSYYNPVHVTVVPSAGVDLAIQRVVTPFDKVYMDNDTVRVNIINYGRQAASNFAVVYQLRDVGGQTDLQLVRETYTGTIGPGEDRYFSFDSLINVVEGHSYELRVWTDYSNDDVRRNDTIRNTKVFTSLLSSVYGNNVDKRTFDVLHPEGMDITRVSVSGVDYQLAPIGRDYTSIGAPNDTIDPVIHMIKGAADTIIVEVSNSDKAEDYETKAALYVYIDYNRNGQFEEFERIFKDTVLSNGVVKFVYSYPYDYQELTDTTEWGTPLSMEAPAGEYPNLGYTRMRFYLVQDANDTMDLQYEIPFGTVQDYLLKIEDQPVPVDLSATRVVSPRNIFIEEDSTTIVFSITNNGGNTVTSTRIDYAFIDGDPTDPTGRGSFNWTGNLLPGHSETVSLPTRHLAEGTTLVKICVTTVGDTITRNDTLWYEYHRFKTVTLFLKENFEGEDIWYAPRGFTNHNINYWQRGVTRKPNLRSSYSDSTVWATSLTSKANTHGRGSLSYLYSPYIDISQIRPDTISFWMASDLAANSSVWLEVYDYRGRWIRVGSQLDTMWYDASEGFTGSSIGYSFKYYRYSTNAISGEFQQRLQFRFVFRALTTSGVGDGVVLDNVFIDRRQRAVDVGVTEIVYPVNPRFGETIYPRVIVKNYGFDTIYSIDMAYHMYGMNMPRLSNLSVPEGLKPGQTMLYTYPDPFVVRADFPDTFEICAYTVVNSDIYWENDSCCHDFALAPLNNDMSMSSILYPLERAIAGDSLDITVRMRNYGSSPVSNVRMMYTFNNTTVEEDLNFNTVLGRPLQSMEYYNYTFRKRCRATMGRMNLTTVVKYDNDDYIYNDTLKMSVQGITSIADLAAVHVSFDSLSWRSRHYLELEIQNVGSQGVTEFDVGYILNNDSSTLTIEHWRGETPFASLSSMYYRFEPILSPAQGGFPVVKAFVTAPTDNDHSNDTTSIIVPHSFDLQANKIMIEENREDTCKVRVEVVNVGSVVYWKRMYLTVTVNGQTLTRDINREGTADTMFMYPNQPVVFTMPGHIAKSSTRDYQGTLTLSRLQLDLNSTNDQTNRIEVVNYFEGVPLVDDASAMSLRQNYPNPYTDETHIDFFIPAAGKVRFFVMDQIGRKVYEKTAEYPMGENTILLGSELNVSGTYYYGIEYNGKRLMRKLVFKR